MIDKAKQGAIIDSFYGYKEAINSFYIEKISSNEDFFLDGIYFVNDGKLGDYEIPLSGNVPSSGRLYYKDNELVIGNITIDDYVVTISDNNVKATKGKYIINVLSEEQQKTRIDGLYNSEYDEGRLLYRGKKPNNYLILPEKGIDTLYRIISYEKDGTIKVIRDDRIGNTTIKWDSAGTVTKAQWRQNDFDEQKQIKTRYNDDNKYCQYYIYNYGCNVWGNQYNTYYEGQTLNHLYDSFHYKWYLNDDTKILNPMNITEDIKKLTVTQEASLNILLNREWLPEVGLGEYIEDHAFDVGGIYPNNKDLATEKKEQSLYKWYGKIGLMYITDMVESSTNPDCKSVYTGQMGSFPCKNTIVDTEYGNWLQKISYNDWSITANSSDSNHNTVWCINSSGEFGKHIASGTLISTRPVFFLKNNISMIGEGTKENPYRIINNLDY